MVCEKSSSFAKTICSICYEDLKPIVEDLQAISICGHVFHELCIQQWFGYCPNGKKISCPVCKQNCSEDSVSRLYFQSIGDSASTQKPTISAANSVELQLEVEKLRGKVLGLSSALERQQKDAKELREELCLSKELTAKETALKNETLRQKASIQQLLCSKLEELDKSTVKCTGLQERNTTLAKEIAALKLAFDLNLMEDDVLKLASLMNKGNLDDKTIVFKEIVDVRDKSHQKLIDEYRKSYKELMAKCNAMGREQTRSLRKIEKKKQEIKLLKSRVQELEKAAEEQENDVLRDLKKASKRARCEKGMQNDAELAPNFSFIAKCSNTHAFEPLNLDNNGSKANPFSPSETKKFKSSKNTGTTNPVFDTSSTTLNKGMGSNNTVDENLSNTSPAMDSIHKRFERPRIIEDTIDPQTSVPSQKEKSENIDYVTVDESDSADTVLENLDDEVVILDDIKQFKSFPNIEKKASHPAVIAQSGDVCFSGGLLAPDGTQRHLGKWCKRAQSNRSVVPPGQGSGVTSGDLIAVGADGRGGKIKVLRSLNQPSESKETTSGAKRFKVGAKNSSGLQSQGFMPIEHFFRKASS